jgi:hypothetical protein
VGLEIQTPRSQIRSLLRTDICPAGRAVVLSLIGMRERGAWEAPWGSFLPACAGDARSSRAPSSVVLSRLGWWSCAASRPRLTRDVSAWGLSSTPSSGSACQEQHPSALLAPPVFRPRRPLLHRSFRLATSTGLQGPLEEKAGCWATLQSRWLALGDEGHVSQSPIDAATPTNAPTS